MRGRTARENHAPLLNLKLVKTSPSKAATMLLTPKNTKFELVDTGAPQLKSATVSAVFTIRSVLINSAMKTIQVEPVALLVKRAVKMPDGFTMFMDEMDPDAGEAGEDEEDDGEAEVAGSSDSAPPVKRGRRE